MSNTYHCSLGAIDATASYSDKVDLGPFTSIEQAVAFTGLPADEFIRRQAQQRSAPKLTQCLEEFVDLF